MSNRRILLGTIVATSFIPIQLFVPYHFIQSAWINVLLSFLIIFTTFGHRHLLKKVLYFYFISFIIGGGMMALQAIFEHAILNRSYMLVVNNIQGSETSLLLLIIGSFGLFYFTKGQLNEQRRDQYMYKQQYKMAIKLNGIEKQTIGYVDTGNHLIDSLSRRPVIVCDAEYLAQFFSATDWAALCRVMEEEQFHDLPSYLKEKIRIVPYQAVGGESKYMYTLKVERLTIFKGEDCFVTKHLLVGIQLQALISDRSYHCLLHPDLLHIHALQVA